MDMPVADPGHLLHQFQLALRFLQPADRRLLRRAAAPQGQHIGDTGGQFLQAAGLDRVKVMARHRIEDAKVPICTPS